MVPTSNFKFNKTNKCELVNVADCAEYNTDGTCKKCDANHYLIENFCSNVNSFKEENAYTNIRNCYSYEVIDSGNANLDLKYGCK